MKVISHFGTMCLMVCLSEGIQKLLITCVDSLHAVSLSSRDSRRRNTRTRAKNFPMRADSTASGQLCSGEAKEEKHCVSTFKGISCALACFANESVITNDGSVAEKSDYSDRSDHT